VFWAQLYRQMGRIPITNFLFQPTGQMARRRLRASSIFLESEPSRSRTLPHERATAMATGGGAAARMDPEAATELVRKGATLLLLDVPQRTLFGIDTQVGGIRPPMTPSRSELFAACVKQCDGFFTSACFSFFCRCSLWGPSSKG
jgi:hypothetical protein